MHAHHELELMLAGRKPLAVFSRLVGERFDMLSGQDFAAAVRAGTIVQRQFFVQDDDLGRKKSYTAYALPGEEWRIAAYRGLMRELRYRWDDELEFMQGLLLGYSVDSCMAHIDSRRVAHKGESF